MRRPSAAELRAAAPETAWALIAVGAVLWGFVAPGLLPRANACVDRHTFAWALAVQVVLLLGAVALTILRCARLGFSGTATVLIVVAITLPWAVGTLYIWFATGICGNLSL